MSLLSYLQHFSVKSPLWINTPRIENVLIVHFNNLLQFRCRFPTKSIILHLCTGFQILKIVKVRVPNKKGEDVFLLREGFSALCAGLVKIRLSAESPGRSDEFSTLPFYVQQTQIDMSPIVIDRGKWNSVPLDERSLAAVTQTECYAGALAPSLPREQKLRTTERGINRHVHLRVLVRIYASLNIWVFHTEHWVSRFGLW